MSRWVCFAPELNQHLFLTTTAKTSEIETALAVVERSMPKLSHEAALRAITKLYVLCNAKWENGDDIKLRLGAYVELMLDEAADAVTHVLREWPKKHKHFPAWAELQVLIHKETGFRSTARERLREMLHKSIASD